DPGAAFGTQQGEELRQGGLRAALGQPQHPPGGVIHHHRQVLVATLVGDLIHPDAGDPVQAIGAGGVRLGHHPGDDGPDRGPADPTASSPDTSGSNRTDSTTTCSTPSSPAHTLNERTPLPPPRSEAFNKPGT